MRLSHSPIRTLLADDNGLVRLAVRGRLEGAGFEICAEAGSAEGAVAAALREQPALCLVDVALRDGGVATIRALRSAAPEAAIVILTDAANEDLFLDAVRDVVDGKTALPRSLVGLLLDEIAA
jgi:DNA-binding NarL/FixJ family response regulator